MSRRKNRALQDELRSSKSGLEPDGMTFTQLPNGGAIVGLPNGVERVYDEDELADYVVDLVHRAHAEPETVDERWLEVVKRAVGQERWDQAIAVIASIIR